MRCCLALYLLDYRNTLDSVEDPISFLEALREKHGGDCLIVVTSGSKVPGPLVDSADFFWKKPVTLGPLRELYEGGMRSAVVSDDSELLARAYCRSLLRIGFSVTQVDPGDLMTLLL